MNGYQPRIYAEQTLQERAREYEKASMWRKAAETWQLSGNKIDADACIMIAESNERGDAYRARVLAVAGPEPEVEGDKCDSIKWMKWYKDMEKVYREMFGSAKVNA
jgi:hypothetical protein